MGASQKLHQMETILGSSEKWVLSLKPVFTKSMARKDSDYEEDDEFCTTPTSEESRISARLVCPPAPKKRKHASSPNSKKSCHCGGGRREFFNPPDLETIFMRREKGFC